MVYEQELADLNHFIDNFDPQEFTTDTNLNDTVDKKLRLQRAEKVRSRLQLKRQRKQRFYEIEFTQEYDANDVIITQEQIDALLNKN